MRTDASGLPELAERGLRVVTGGDQPIVLVPTESVRLLRVDLPFAGRAKRIEAVPFAIEDQIADPIEAVHVALGSEIAPRSHLVGVVRHSVMSDWLAALEAAALADAALVPDALLLGVPEQGWRIAVRDGRALIRAADATGFALPVELLPQAWRQAGEPGLLLEEGGLPAGMESAAVTPSGAEALTPRQLTSQLDLRQPPYARRIRLAIGRHGALRRLGWIAGLGIAAHAGIAAADTLMLGVIAGRRANDTRNLIAQMAPGVNIGGDIAATASGMLPEPQRPDRFLPALSRVSAALAPVGALSTRAIRFEGGRLTMEIDAADPDLENRVRAALASAGIAAEVSRPAPDIVQIRVNGA